MTRPFRELERLEHRVLGALRFVDAPTGADVAAGPLQVRALEGRARFVRNRSGILVVSDWSELEAHAASFRDPPELPAAGSRTLPLSVTDPTGRYVPRRVALPLPRDPTPEDPADSLFRAVDVRMYPTSGAPTGSNWSVLRASVTEDATGDLLGGALLRVRRNGDVLARGLTDGRGEGLLAVVGIPLLTFGEDDEAVVVDEVAVTVEAFFDPATGTRMTTEALRQGARPPTPDVDPDTLEQDSEALPQAALPLAVAARRSRAVSLAIELP